MGFVIQMAPGKAEAGPHTGVLGPADNALLTHPAGSAGLPSPSRGHLGATTAI
jgi:hypothetical protein